MLQSGILVAISGIAQPVLRLILSCSAGGYYLISRKQTRTNTTKLLLQLVTDIAGHAVPFNLRIAIVQHAGFATLKVQSFQRFVKAIQVGVRGI